MAPALGCRTGWGLGVRMGRTVGHGRGVQHRGVWSSPAPLPSWATQPSFPRTTPIHCPAPGVCGEQSLPRAVASSRPCARTLTVPHFSETETGFQSVAGKTPRTIEFTPWSTGGRERGSGSLLASGCSGSRPGWGTALGLHVSAPTPFPSRFQNQHPGKKCSPQMPASPSCEIFAFFISNEHVSTTVSISKHGKVCFDRSGASREAGPFNQPPL